MRKLTGLAAVQVGSREVDLREMPVPASLPPDCGLLRVEANGLCGTDYAQYTGDGPVGGNVYPIIHGHEPVGRIEWIGDDARARWRVSEGDRVIVESITPCRLCRMCLSGREKFCANKGLSYGFVPLSVDHGLWGGFSQYMVLRRDSVLHRVPDGVSMSKAALNNALAGGFEWTLRVGGVGLGDRVLVMGPGQRGIACVLAAAEAGARQIIVTGLTRDRPRLDLALEFGATHAIDVEQEDLVVRVEEITGGHLVDRAVDCSHGAVRPILDALDVTAPGGTVVLAGAKGPRDVPGLLPQKIISNGLRIAGAFSVSSWAIEQALRVVAVDRYPFDRYDSHVFPLERVEDAIRLLGGEGDAVPFHVTVMPWGANP